MEPLVFGQVSKLSRKRSLAFSRSDSDLEGPKKKFQPEVPVPACFTHSIHYSKHSVVTDSEPARLLERHMELLSEDTQLQEFGEIANTPIFAASVLGHTETASSKGIKGPISQYGLIADPRIFFNVAAPSSTIICGSQGSGKSHTLSCLLENCSIPSDANKLPRPLTGLLFHYDTFISDHRASPCEAAYLASSVSVRVRVFCSPMNIRNIIRAYQGLNVQVEPLIFKESELNTKRILNLMAVFRENGYTPHYIHMARKVLRDICVAQQENRGDFSYAGFKSQLMAIDWSKGQLEHLQQGLDTLESFMNGPKLGRTENDWTPKPGCLTIVDLSCPCITPESACSLFNICLSIFLEQKPTIGRIVALDEAHKYMDNSSEANTLADNLLSAVRLQRHLGVRTIISTQEPTISPILLDLSSVTIVHQFTSPDWFRTLRLHLAAAASNPVGEDGAMDDMDEAESVTRNATKKHDDATEKIFGEIVKLKAGDALFFSPSAMIGLERGPSGELGIKRLGADCMKVRVRKRVTTDEGKSIMAT